MKFKMNRVVARRLLTSDDSANPRHVAEIVIGTPVRNATPDGADWYCPVCVVGIGDDEVRAAFGADSLQALYLALVLARVFLSSSPLGSELRFDGMAAFGLPAASPDLDETPRSER